MLRNRRILLTWIPLWLVLQGTSGNGAHIGDRMIDAHQHFWNYSAKEYGWMDDRMDAIRRDFLPEHLRDEIRQAGISGSVAVQARQTLQETEWLLELAQLHDFLRGVIGWVPLVESDVARHLERLSADRWLKGVRHVLHDEPDDHYILRTDFNAGVASLAAFGLAYDILIFERHLPQAIRFVDLHPNQIFVVNHIAKPRINMHALSPWREHITRMGERENVYCKVSGMVTEADWEGWTYEDLEPYLDTVLSVFGPRRLMFGSDWPVILLASSYQRWIEAIGRYLSRLAPSEREWILGGTALQAYNL